MSDEQAATPSTVVAADAPGWGGAAQRALKKWKGSDASLSLSVQSGFSHDKLVGRFAGRSFVIGFRYEGSVSGTGALVCEEAPSRQALGLDESAPLSTLAAEFVSAIQSAAGETGELRLSIQSEQCAEMTAESIGSLRTLLPVEPVRMIDAVVALNAQTALDVCIVLHDKVLHLGQELDRLAQIGVGKDSHAEGDPRGGTRHDDRLNLLMDVDLPLIVRLGEADLTLDELLRLRPGSVIELNRLVNEPVELIVNNRTVAYGEVVVVHENFGLRVTSLAEAGAEVFA